jgi:formate dehydrogenase major subunit
MQPGVVYTTFHFPGTGANVVTTEFADWATDCPEYKVTAVQVSRATNRSAWQDGHVAFREQTTRLSADGVGVAR